jgi:hypothetical protein
MERPSGTPAREAGVRARRLGERTCMVGLGALVTPSAARAADEAAADAAVAGYRDFVFDLTTLRRYELPAVRLLADLWSRLARLGCEVVVAIRDPGLIALLPAPEPEAGWCLRPSSAEALRSLLARPVA